VRLFFYFYFYFYFVKQGDEQAKSVVVVARDVFAKKKTMR